MRFDEDFGRFLALALAVRRRDEVAVKQFATQMATQLLDDFEVSEARKGSPARNAEAKRRQSERLQQEMVDHMRQLTGLVDDDGMEWLRTQVAA